MYGQRGIPVMLEFCKDIREVAEPGCLLLNYANPNAMITWACNKYGGVNHHPGCVTVFRADTSKSQRFLDWSRTRWILSAPVSTIKHGIYR